MNNEDYLLERNMCLELALDLAIQDCGSYDTQDPKVFDFVRKNYIERAEKTLDIHR